ncbi:MAG TPA: alpha/beta hydrolase-fold protein [Blastocatellia bacterium]|nr:alpha/beta hydrolase-fold protein [Blastocatellia bacterium]
MKSVIINLLPLIAGLLVSPFQPFLQANSGRQSSTTPPSVVGDLRLHQLTSRIFNNDRTIRVLLPAGYDDGANRNRRYPVLYLNDGQNIFDLATSLFNPLEWQVDETVDRLIREKNLSPLIVVGIDCAGRRSRFNEYFPYEDKFLQPAMPFPEGKKYPKFLVEEVLPFINAKYRTKTGPYSTGIGGSSAGAVASLYAVIARPGVFGRLLLESPSLYISDGQLIKDAARTRRWPSRVYIGVGTNESGQVECKPDEINREAVADVLRLKRVLQAAGLNDRRLRVNVEECGRHDEAAWARRFPYALEFLFGRD